MRRCLWFGALVLLAGCGGSGLKISQATATNPPIPTIGLPTIARAPTARLAIPFPPTVTPTLPSGAAAAVAPTHTAIPAASPTAQEAVPTPAVPDATLTNAQYDATYPRIDPRALDKNPEAFKNARFSIAGKATDVTEQNGSTGISLAVPVPGSDYDAIYVQIAVPGTFADLYKGAQVLVYGVGLGSITGKNAFGAPVTNALVRGVSIRYTT
jgi:hypothetical protein